MCRGRGAAAEPLTVAMNRLDLTSAARRSPLARPRQPPHRGNVLANLTAMLLASAIGFALGFGLLEETTTSIRQARLLSPLGALGFSSDSVNGKRLGQNVEHGHPRVE